MGKLLILALSIQYYSAGINFKGIFDNHDHRFINIDWPFWHDGRHSIDPLWIIQMVIIKVFMMRKNMKSSI